MDQAPTSQQSHSGQGVGTAVPSASLPDLNTGAYPFDLVLSLLNKAASFNIFAIPNPSYSQPSNPNDAFNLKGGFVLDIHSRLHRFTSIVQHLTLDRGLKVRQAVGEATGTFQCRLMVSPDDFGWVPGQEPIPVLVDPLLSQRFVMLDSRFAFGDGKDSFQGYGVGRTFPVTTHGRTQLLAGAVGNLTEGFGKFKGLEGTYMLNGSITPAFGFLGNITLRVVDWDGKLRTDSEIRPLEQISDPNPGVTYILLHGQKKDQYQKTAYIFGTGGSVLGLDTPAQWRSAQYSFTDRGYRGLRSNRSVFEIVGALDAKIYTNLLAPPGTADAPALFTTQELYTFVDRDGRTVGTITAGVAEGESFNLTFPAAPGQPGLRFGGFGPIQGGTGPFVGVQGMLTVNSLIGISPHVLSLMHVLRIIDPDGRFRAGFNGT